MLAPRPFVQCSGRDVVGQVLLTSKGDKQVLKMTYRLSLRKTTVNAQNQQSIQEFTISEIVDSTGFEIKTGETRTLNFSIPYGGMAAPGAAAGVMGVLGALGQMAASASGTQEAYFLVAVCDVKGTALAPSDRVQLTLVN